MSNAQVYVQFLDRLSDRIKALGITAKDNAGWVALTGSNGHRIVVQKSATRLPVVETTLPMEAVDGIALKNPNGRIQCRLPADPDRVAKALELLVDETMPIPAPKRGGKPTSIPSLDALLSGAPAVAVPAPQAAEDLEQESPDDDGDMLVGDESDTEEEHPHA